MRVRRLATLFWALCTVVGFLSIYYLTEKVLKTPSRSSTSEQAKENKWVHFEDKLKRLESEVSEYHAMVGELKVALQELSPHENNVRPERIRSLDQVLDKIEHFGQKETSETSQCAAQTVNIPNSHIQMLKVYEELKFDNPDGGPWKQGWRITQNPNQWSSHHKLKVIILPHSHNDPGWLKTFEEYYNTQTRSILNNVLLKLGEDTRRKFVWAEISYFSMWWDEITEEQRRQVKKLIDAKQLEIVTGGWVMNDEATAHWISIAQQLTTGHQWVKEHLSITPKSSWTIDPFGHSATQPYLLKLTGINGSLIQRIHYSVKKEFAKKQQLEFRWRQTWDSLGSTDMWTHMMPFYSYDIPHSCGPDPKICCQFDFKRLPGYGLTCPWKISPQVITERNVNQKAELLLDQWRKKAQLYKTRVLLMPLGDDFRWDHSTEWDAQFNNYDKIINYLNRNTNLHVEVSYGTLSDYFNAVMSEKASEEFPILSGDFFTYADRDDHYWSGYYTSRPFYKRMDRVLMAYLRAAESILTLARSKSRLPSSLLDSESELSSILDFARQSLSLFQHHDGVTGTARDLVVINYGKKLLKSISHCQRVIQQSVYHLLVQPEFFHPVKDQIYFEIDDVRREHNSLPERNVITIGLEVPSRKVVFYNALSFTRTEVVTLFISTPFVMVEDDEGNAVECQVSPVILSGTRIVDYQFQLSFITRIPALGLKSYIITAVEKTSSTQYTTFAKVQFLNYDGGAIDGKIFETEVLTSSSANDFTMKKTNNDGLIAAFSKFGLLKAIKSPLNSLVPIHLDFRKYGTKPNGDKSGAYLFLPNVDTSIIDKTVNLPVINLIEGPLISKMSVQYQFVQHNVAMYAGQNDFIEITNVVDVTESHNMELVMRLSTNIKNDDEFYTDLNGFQMIRRKYFQKLPLQANFYPVTTAAYIEDLDMRMTILTSTSLGGAALSGGQFEIMQDRRLNQDDNRGLGQGVLDNHPTQHVYRILLEKKHSNCERQTEEHPAGHLSLGAYVASETLLNPLISLFYNGDGHSERSGPEWLHGSILQNSYKPMIQEPGVDVSIVSYRDNVLSTLPNGKSIRGKGLVIHKQYLNLCYTNEEQLKKYSLNDGKVKLSEMIPSAEIEIVKNSSLSFLHLGSTIDQSIPQEICPMEIYSYFIHN